MKCIQNAYLDSRILSQTLEYTLQIDIHPFHQYVETKE